MQRGQSLFEVVLSLAVISMVIVALVSLASRAVGNTTFSKNKTSSSRFAQEAAEWIRGERDVSWTAFFNHALTSPNYCLQDLGWLDIGNCSTNEFIQDTVLIRSLTLTVISPDQIQAEIEVSWEDSQGEHSTRVVTDYTNWQGN